MQLILKGPDIRERLLQAHEDGRVVFVCGAGISYPAGLPGFGRLVERIRDNLGLTFSEPQKSAFKRASFTTLPLVFWKARSSAIGSGSVARLLRS